MAEAIPVKGGGTMRSGGRSSLASLLGGGGRTTKALQIEVKQKPTLELIRPNALNRLRTRDKTKSLAVESDAWGLNATENGQEEKDELILKGLL